MTRFRERVLDATDEWYDFTDGGAPDHIIVSESKYEDISVEQLRRGGRNSGHLDTGDGYVGMVLWSSAALEKRDTEAIFLKDTDLRRLFPRAKDF